MYARKNDNFLAINTTKYKTINLNRDNSFYLQHDPAYSALKPVLSDVPRLGQKKGSVNRGGLLIEVKCMVKPQLGHDQVVFE